MYARPIPEDTVALYRTEAFLGPPEDAPRCPQMIREGYTEGPPSRCLYPKTRKALGYDSEALCELRGRCPVQATMQEATGEEFPVAPAKVSWRRRAAFPKIA
jgi:hypothetical protein